MKATSQPVFLQQLGVFDSGTNLTLGLFGLGGSDALAFKSGSYIGFIARSHGDVAALACMRQCVWPVVVP